MNGKMIRRFTVVQRISHGLLMMNFLLQAATGLARLMIDVPFGQRLAALFGGYDQSLTVHKVGGVVMVILFLAHVIYLARVYEWKKFPGNLFGPDSILPRLTDFNQFFQHIGWFFGLAAAPRFDRWTYYEKFGYWAVFWGVPLFGLTGFMLFDPVVTARLVPGWILNVALVLHREEFFLATGYLFIVHFVVVHLRRTNFPMDLAIFSGRSDLTEIEEDRPGWIDRLQAEGRLASSLVREASTGFRAIFYTFGGLMLLSGILLLLFGLVNLRYLAL